VPPLRRQGPQNIFALRVRSAEDLLLVPLPAEPLRHSGAAAAARPRTRLADATPEGAHTDEHQRPHRPPDSRNATEVGTAGEGTALFCPECGDAVEDVTLEHYLVPGLRPGYRHVADRTALCPVMTAAGYRPAEPVEHQVAV
jgi:hypothetical protein